MLVILKNHEHINELQGAVSVQGQTNTNSKYLSTHKR